VREKGPEQRININVRIEFRWRLPNSRKQESTFLFFKVFCAAERGLVLGHLGARVGARGAKGQRRCAFDVQLRRSSPHELIPAEVAQRCARLRIQSVPRSPTAGHMFARRPLRFGHPKRGDSGTLLLSQALKRVVHAQRPGLAHSPRVVKRLFVIGIGRHAKRHKNARV